MEIVIKNLYEKDIVIDNSKITGIYNEHDIIKAFKNPKEVTAKILINNNEYKKMDNKNIAIVDNKEPFFTATVYHEILFNAKIREYKCPNIKDKILKLFNELGLSEDILKRSCHALSNTEKYLVKIVINLIYEPKIIILKDIMSNIYKKIKKLITRLKEEQHLVIVTSNNCNVLYEITDDIIIFNNKKVIYYGDTVNAYTNEIEYLLKNKVDVPYYSLLTYQALTKKNINLFYRKDVRDVIKDVYKSIS